MRRFDKRDNIKRANNRLNESKKTKGPIDIDKLLKYAEGIEVICNGEYGTTYYNEEENKIFICLGVSNPFDDDLMWYMRDAIKSSWEVKDEEIEIEIENESSPSGEGWKRIRKGKLIDA